MRRDYRKESKEQLATMNLWELRQANRLREQMSSDEHSYEDERGVLRWKSNDNAVPMSCFRDAAVTPPGFQREALDEELMALLEGYSDEVTPEKEFEMRAAFGAGTTVVNVLTGRKFKL